MQNMSQVQWRDVARQDHEAPVVFEVSLKIVMRNIASLLYKWLKS